MASGIYTITNTVNNKVYVGSSINIDKRLYEHKRQLMFNIHNNKHLQSAWNKYEEFCFEFETLEEVSPEYLISAEQYWMNLLNAVNDNFGYNILVVAGNTTGRAATDYNIEMTMLSLQKRNFCKGKDNPNFGKTATPETAKRKIDAKLKSGTMNTKEIFCYDYKGNLLTSSIFVRELFEFTEVDFADIRRCLNGEMKQSKGFVFSYSNDTEQIRNHCENLAVKGKYANYGKVREIQKQLGL